MKDDLPSKAARFRRTLRWAGLMATIAIVLLFVVSVLWLVGIGGRYGFIGVSGGALGIRCAWDGQSDSPTIACEAHEHWSDVMRWFWHWGVTPTVRRSSIPPVTLIAIPLWIPFVLIGLPTLWLWRLDRRRKGPECCVNCGYDLTGNTSGRCPECGAACEIAP